MKRKLLSFVIAFALLAQTLVFAEDTLTSTLRSANGGNPVEPPTISSRITSKARNSATSAYMTGSVTGSNVDYEASIDMSSVQAAFNSLYAGVSTNAPSRLAELNASYVTGTFYITFTYTPSITGTLLTPAGIESQFPAGSVFTVTNVSAPVTSGAFDVVTVTVDVKNNAATGNPYTVGEFNSNLATYLADMQVEQLGLTSPQTNSTITVALNGTVDIIEPYEYSTSNNAFAHLTFDGNHINSIPTVTINVSSSGGGSTPVIEGGGSGPSTPDTTDAIGVSDSGTTVDVPISGSGNNQYVKQEDLPTVDENGRTILGWYADPEHLQPLTPDPSGRIKITDGTKIYARTVPVASSVVDEVVDSVEVNDDGNGEYFVDMNTLPTVDAENHTIYGWDLDEDHQNPAIPDANGILPITGDTTLYPRLTPIVVTVLNGTRYVVDGVEQSGDTFTVDVDSLEVPQRDGYAFLGWYTEPNFLNQQTGVITITRDTELYPRFRSITPPEQMISDEHNLYVYGYPDGEVKPNGYVTREEVAAMFYRLLKPEYRATIESSENSFPDVDSSRWSNSAISTMANGGYIVGNDDGYFNPGKPITRAEFTVIASKFANVDTIAENTFTDISGHWAMNYILKAVSQTWITGYDDLTFKPQNKITRAEAMTIINTMLVRYGDVDATFAKQWPDLKKTDWYYDEVIEATTSHKFERNADGWSEKWISE